MLALSVGLMGCPESASSGPAKTCAEAYQQCVLPGGVLGVCDTADCAEGQPPPCLVCRSQH